MILITGATGKIGSELIQDLTARRCEFKVMVRTREAVKACEAKGIKAVLGDFSQPASFAAALTGVKQVFLLTIPLPDAPVLEARFLETCRIKGIQHIVRVSAIGANPAATSGLLRNHGKCEALLEATGIPWTHLRPTIFMQNLAVHFGASVAKESTLYAPAGDARMPWVDVRDIASVAGTVLTGKNHEHLVYEITGPQALTYDQVAEQLSALLGRRISFVDVPDGAAHQAMLGMGLTPWMAEGMLNLYHAFKINGHTAQVVDTVERLTGHPARTLAAYLREHESTFKTQRATAEVLRN